MTTIVVHGGVRVNFAVAMQLKPETKDLMRNGMKIETKCQCPIAL